MSFQSSLIPPGEKSNGKKHRQTWFLVFVLGFAVVFSTNLLYSITYSQGWLWGATVILIGLMLLYGWVVGGNKSVSVDTKADGIYYLGLLFTFTALVATLIFSQILNSGAGGLSEQLFANFGIALVTTIFGLAGRVWFTMMQKSPGDLGANATESLSDAVDIMKAHVLRAGQMMEQLVEHLAYSETIWQETITGIGATAQSVEKANNHFQAATSGFAETMAALNKPLTDTGQSLFQLNIRCNNLGEAIVRTQTGLASFDTSHLTNGVAEFRESISDTSQQLGQFQSSLERTRSYVAKFGDKIEQDSQALDGVDHTGQQIAALGTKLTAFASALASLQTTLNEIVQTSETVSGTVTRTGKVILHASAAVDRASDPFRQLETAVNDLPNDIAHIRDGMAHLGDSLTTARKKSRDLQAKLDIAHNSVPSPIITRSRKWIKRLMLSVFRNKRSNSNSPRN